MSTCGSTATVYHLTGAGDRSFSSKKIRPFTMGLEKNGTFECVIKHLLYLHVEHRQSLYTHSVHEVHFHITLWMYSFMTECVRACVRAYVPTCVCTYVCTYVYYSHFARDHYLGQYYILWHVYHTKTKNGMYSRTCLFP